VPNPYKILKVFFKKPLKHCVTGSWKRRLRRLKPGFPSPGDVAGVLTGVTKRTAVLSHIE